MAHKELKYDAEARASLQAGVDGLDEDRAGEEAGQQGSGDEEKDGSD